MSDRSYLRVCRYNEYLPADPRGRGVHANEVLAADERSLDVGAGPAGERDGDDIGMEAG